LKEGKQAETRKGGTEAMGKGPRQTYSREIYAAVMDPEGERREAMDAAYVPAM
jgi:hypothetical protein